MASTPIEGQCPICLENSPDIERDFVTLPCHKSHAMHADCIQPWIADGQFVKCPMARCSLAHACGHPIAARLFAAGTKMAAALLKEKCDSCGGGYTISTDLYVVPRVLEIPFMRGPTDTAAYALPYSANDVWAWIRGERAAMPGPVASWLTLEARTAPPVQVAEIAQRLTLLDGSLCTMFPGSDEFRQLFRELCGLVPPTHDAPQQAQPWVRTTTIQVQNGGVPLARPQDREQLLKAFAVEIDALRSAYVGIDAYIRSAEAEIDDLLEQVDPTQPLPETLVETMRLVAVKSIHLELYNATASLLDWHTRKVGHARTVALGIYPAPKAPAAATETGSSSHEELDANVSPDSNDSMSDPAMLQARDDENEEDSDDDADDNVRYADMSLDDKFKKLHRDLSRVMDWCYFGPRAQARPRQTPTKIGRYMFYAFLEWHYPEWLEHLLRHPAQLSHNARRTYETTVHLRPIFLFAGKELEEARLWLNNSAKIFRLTGEEQAAAAAQQDDLALELGWGTAPGTVVFDTSKLRTQDRRQCVYVPRNGLFANRGPIADFDKLSRVGQEEDVAGPEAATESPEGPAAVHGFRTYMTRMAQDGSK